MWIEFLILGFFTFINCANGEENINTTSSTTNSSTSSSEYSTDYSINSVNEERYSYSARAGTHSNRRYGFYKRKPYSNPMPECASQQVCNAVFMRLKFVQPLCRCASSYHSPCSTRMNPNDAHTINLLSDRDGQKSQTLIKVCEDVSSVKQCHHPHDWMLLALQNVRTGKAHYLVVCKCPSHAIMEGPVLHTQPPYARIPGISVYGMLCVQGRKSRLRKENYPPIPWDRVINVYNSSYV